MASGFTEDSVRNFIIKNGCKVTNHELVTQFKSYLNDPVLKGQNRDKFKDFVNTLATIKVDEKNEKVLVLKKKYRPAEIEATSERATSEPPDKPGDDDFDGGGMSKVRSEGQLSVKDNVSETSSLQGSVDTLSVGSSNSQTSVDQVQSTQGTKPDDDVNASVISVKDRARHLNKIQSESELIKHQSDTNLRRKDRHVRDKENDAGEDDSHSSGIGYTSYTPEQKQWLAVCSSGEYHEIHRMVTKHPFIAKTKDFTSGYTALHWAAKHGNPEVCKLLLSRPGVEVDKRSNGGYTPLHLAAMHGHEHIIELLVQTYKADSNIRDYSGKKAKQYLRNSASTKAQRKNFDLSSSVMSDSIDMGSITLAGPELPPNTKVQLRSSVRPEPPAPSERRSRTSITIQHLCLQDNVESSFS